MLTKTTGTDFTLGCAKHLFTIIPKGKLEWAASSMKQVTPFYFIAPGTVMVEFPGMHSGSCLLPTITFPIKPSLLLEKIWVILYLWVNHAHKCSEGSVYT